MRLQRRGRHRPVGQHAVAPRAPAPRSGSRARRSSARSPRPPGPGQQHHLGALDAAAGAADLLVVGDGRGRRPEVDDEAEVGLVEAHAERARGDERLDPVGEQVVLGGAALGVVGAAGVRRGRDAARAQERGQLLGRGDGQAVDDPAARQVAAGGRPARPSGARRSAAAAPTGAAIRARGPRAGPGRRRPRRRPAARRRRARPGRSRWRWSPAPACRSAARRAACGCAGSRAGSRGPSR